MTFHVRLFKTKIKTNTYLIHSVSWVLLAFLLRFTIIEAFYRDSYLIKNWVTVGQVLQTIIIYYSLGYFVFPKYLYHLNIGASLFGIFICHIFIYESNYLLFWYLQQLNHSPRIERDWIFFRNAGLLGFVTNASASTWSFFYSFPVGLIFLGVLSVKDIIALRTKNLVLEKEKLNLELGFLKSQVNPHFLFNTLNSVYSRIFDTDEKAADLILRLSELMRYNLYETNLPTIALDKELAYIQNYLDLERNRLSDRYVVIDYEQSGDASAYQITPLLLITFVENAFKHGIKGAIKPAYVQIRADVTANQLVFRVENSVPDRLPVTDNSDKKSGGIGLENIRKRLAALYQDKYELVLIATENTYEVTLIIQLISILRSENVIVAN